MDDAYRVALKRLLNLEQRGEPFLLVSARGVDGYTFVNHGLDVDEVCKKLPEERRVAIGRRYTTRG